MAKFEDCEITYQVELETKNLQGESKKVREELKELNNSGSKVSKGLEQLETSAKIRATLSTNLIAMWFINVRYVFHQVSNSFSISVV